MSAILIADSGSTKAEWCWVEGNKKKRFITRPKPLLCFRTANAPGI